MVLGAARPSAQVAQKRRAIQNCMIDGCLWCEKKMERKQGRRGFYISLDHCGTPPPKLAGDTRERVASGSKLIGE